MSKRLLFRYHVSRLRWIVRTSGVWWGFTNPGLAVRAEVARLHDAAASFITTTTNRGKDPSWASTTPTTTALATAPR